MDTHTENNIVENVIKKLIAQGLLEKELQSFSKSEPLSSPVSAFKQTNHPAQEQELPTVLPLTLDPLNTIRVDNPYNLEALKMMRKATPARILMGRCGARPKTASFLHFLADHAAAVDAVFSHVSDHILKQNNLFKVQTMASNKDEFLMKPELGKRLNPEAQRLIMEKCRHQPQVQIIVVDGLSSSSIEANISDIMPALIQGLQNEGLTVGVPFFVQYGRVGVMDDIAPLLKCEVIVEFIGERPGLITAESMSAYLAYKPHHETVEADRTVISNIHRGGTPPVEAGAHLASLVQKMIIHKASGIKLAELM